MDWVRAADDVTGAMAGVEFTNGDQPGVRLTKVAAAKADIRGDRTGEISVIALPSLTPAAVAPYSGAFNQRRTFMINSRVIMLIGATGLTAALAAPARAEDVLTVHRLSAALAAEAVTEAVATCAKQGYKVTATIIDSDGVPQAMLRGDGASMTTIGAARDKAYTVFMLGAPRNEDTSAAIAQRMAASQTPGGLAKLPHILLAAGGVRIKAGNEAIAAIGVGGAPGGDLDEACAKAGIDKISDRVK